MTYRTLIPTSLLSQHLDDPAWVIVDCRFALDDPTRGERDYEQGHIPSAVYAHLERDLTGTIIPGKTGRHPLPSIEHLVERFSAWGIDANVQVIAYDDSGGSTAARLWWLLRWLGHEAVAVLDGGWSVWRAEGRPFRRGHERRSPRRFIPRPRPELVASVEDVLMALKDPSYRLVDARSPERYRGEHEPIDPVAGHIPGAICAPYFENLDARGFFRPADELRARFEQILGGIPPSRAIFYCGSGVTAAHNLLALLHAGLGEARLYPGSWSEWITDPTRPIERSLPERSESM
ncbi:MAG: sulfurtransferase [Blastocatellia bacterium]|nr:sulfurtransferase [Blastocatellia bacterium]MCS7157193.1 sulfurtransferase [Blastocatellia bacterium]MCX7752344.1 sulfurtransferase [Blastocatellia bacterium]MDW8167225.1 sulfurtransferase [Acidobacteriota bacterium]